MKTFALKSLALAALITAPLAAQALTAETFAQIDVNADGEVDMTEAEAAQAAGLLPQG